MLLFGYFWRVIALIHSRKWEGHNFFRKKILKYPVPTPPPNKNVPSLIVRRIGISWSYRMFFPCRFRPFLPLGSRSLLCACHVGYAWQGQKEDEKRREKSAKRVLFRHTFFRSRPFDFWEGWGVWVIWFGYEFFFSNLWRYNFFFYLQIYNGVRIFPVLYAMNFSPAGQFFSWNHRSPYPRRKSQLCRSSPKLERGRLCLYFVLSPFLHMLAGRLLGKKKINSGLLCFFFRSDTYF